MRMRTRSYRIVRSRRACQFRARRRRCFSSCVQLRQDTTPLPRVHRESFHGYREHIAATQAAKEARTCPATLHQMLRRFFLPAVLFLVPCAEAHGSVTFPRPRQAIDGSLSSPWNDTAAPMTTFLYWCPVPGHPAPGHRFNLSGSGGQSCFWFSDGCSIGCDRCTGNSQLLVKNAAFEKIGALSSWGGENIVLANISANNAILFGTAACEHPAKATICDKRLRTLNTNAECGAADDVFYYNPWRYPGSAPVIDSCGSAGGRLPGQGIGNAGRGYINTSAAKLADLGSKTLKPLNTGTVWTAGSSVEVGWMQEAWHGGG